MGKKKEDKASGVDPDLDSSVDFSAAGSDENEPKEKESEKADPDKQDSPEDKESECDEQEANDNLITDYHGNRTRCPNCKRVLLLDRKTQACIVTHTKPDVIDEKNMTKKRYMSCRGCLHSFAAVEHFATK